jgi:hypothetical protein
VKVRFTGRQHTQLFAHLYPGDALESVALVLCGRAERENYLILTVRKIVSIPIEDCIIRTPVCITWRTDKLLKVLEEAEKYNYSILKIHSHPGGYGEFSSTDDKSDQELFASVSGWVENVPEHISAIMLPSGEIKARIFDDKGKVTPVDLVSVAGENLHFYHQNESEMNSIPEFALRHAQAFGSGTFQKLRELTIAVIGASGTGSVVVEQLARLGVGRLILVDHDVIEIKNLNRIVNATMEDARQARPKVKVLADAIRRMELETNVYAVDQNLFTPKVVQLVSEADVVFGCMDTIDGRHLLNRLAAFYIQPYFDIGIRLSADGKGGVDQICGTVHYIQPDGSSLLSRNVYTLEQLRAAAIKRTSPELFESLRKEKYISGVEEDRPAVISVNMLLAATAVNELLARLHNFRDDGNNNFAINGISITQGELYLGADGESCPVLSRHTGRGDTIPLLELPELSIV